MAEESRVVILGAGHAGGVAAATLRQFGYEGGIVLVGDEPLPPYQRPPLSKAWLKGEADGTSLALKPAGFYKDQAIELKLGRRGISIDRVGKSVGLSNGETLTYDALVLAMGARARPLGVQGEGLDGVTVLRSAADADYLKAALSGHRPVSVVVVGGGYIGLEVAASARALGADVVVVEREARLLARVASRPLADFFHDYHASQGVRLELGASVARLQGWDGSVVGVQFADGRAIPCDIAVVGVGVTPNHEIAREAGLEVADGVVVDLDARTSDPSIFAIGDLAYRPMPHYDRMLRMESVPNALEQAKQAASAITGRARPANETPWQWSDQYDLKLQIAGYAFDADRIVVRGDPASARFAVFHLKGERVMSVEAVNTVSEFLVGKQLIGSRRPVSAERLADVSIPMKEVVLEPAT